jgi:hypothetical protein
VLTDPILHLSDLRAYLIGAHGTTCFAGRYWVSATSGSSGASASSPATPTNGQRSSNLVYNVPLTRAAGGPHDVDAAAAATWGQSDVPTDATALFGPEDVPTRNCAKKSSPGVAAYPYAEIHYLNASAQEVNTAPAGGNLDTKQFDRFGTGADRRIRVPAHHPTHPQTPQASSRHPVCHTRADSCRQQTPPVPVVRQGAARQVPVVILRRPP